MIGYLKGKLLDYDDGTVIIECGGVGYEVTCSYSVYGKLVSDGFGELYVYTAVREDDISLFGFIDREEKSMFLKLISVSGIGPKMGIGVLSCMSVNDLKKCIATGNVKMLSQVKGLGKKTAERIVLELKDKVTGDTSGEISVEAPILSEQDEDAVVALTSLGFSRTESTDAVRKAKASGADSVEKIIAAALKMIR